MLTCRVFRKYYNFELDWVAVLSGGDSLVYDLLKALDPEASHELLGT